MLKKINENLKELLEIVNKLTPFAKGLKHFVKRYGCLVLTAITTLVAIYATCVVIGMDKRIKSYANYMLDKVATQEKYKIELEVRGWIKNSYKVCKRNGSFLQDMMDAGHLRLYPQDGVMNCEFESLVHYIINNKAGLLPDVSFLHILIDRKASSPLRELYKKQDISFFLTLAQQEHRDRLAIRNKMLTAKHGIFSNPFLKYKFVNYYKEANHEGLEQAKKYASIFSDKYFLASTDSLAFDNLDAGAYFALRYKNHYVIFYALSGYQYDVEKPKNAVVNYHYLLLDEESFYKTHFYKFINNNNIKL